MSAGDDGSGGPQIQVDSDWKAQARAEKEKLAGKPEDGAGTGPDAASGGTAPGGVAGGTSGGGGGVPPANVETLISSFVTQALFAMGAIPDPQTGQPVMQLDLARYQIDLLAVLEEKTQGNLSDDEQKMLAGTLYELRSRYVQVANAARGAPGI
ncbi:MAG: DUF1844 domain-containing protein [Planctomycetota bacterium]